MNSGKWTCCYLVLVVTLSPQHSLSLAPITRLFCHQTCIPRTQARPWPNDCLCRGERKLRLWYDFQQQPMLLKATVAFALHTHTTPPCSLLTIKPEPEIHSGLPPPKPSIMAVLLWGSPSSLINNKDPIGNYIRAATTWVIVGVTNVSLSQHAQCLLWWDSRVRSSLVR